MQLLNGVDVSSVPALPALKGGASTKVAISWPPRDFHRMRPQHRQRRQLWPIAWLYIMGSCTRNWCRPWTNAQNVYYRYQSLGLHGESVLSIHNATVTSTPMAIWSAPRARTLEDTPSSIGYIYRQGRRLAIFFFADSWQIL